MQWSVLPMSSASETLRLQIAGNSNSAHMLVFVFPGQHRGGSMALLSVAVLTGPMWKCTAALGSSHLNRHTSRWGNAEGKCCVMALQETSSMSVWSNVYGSVRLVFTFSTGIWSNRKQEFLTNPWGFCLCRWNKNNLGEVFFLWEMTW